MFGKKYDSGKLPENLSLYEKVSKVPENAKTIVTSGRHEGLSYLKPQYVIECLTEAFGVCGFGWTATYEVIPQDSDQIVVMKCSLRVRIKEQMSEPIEGFGTGYAKSYNGETGKWIISDDSYKAAQSDSLRKASFNLGIGASLFEDSDESSSEKEGEKEISVKEEERKEIGSIEEALETEYEEGKTVRDFLGRCKTTNDKLKKLIWLSENNEKARKASLFLISVAKESLKKTG